MLRVLTSFFHAVWLERASAMEPVEAQPGATTLEPSIPLTESAGRPTTIAAPWGGPD